MKGVAAVPALADGTKASVAGKSYPRLVRCQSVNAVLMRSALLHLRLCDLVTAPLKRNLAVGGLLAVFVVLVDQATKERALATLLVMGSWLRSRCSSIWSLSGTGCRFGFLASDNLMVPYYLSGFALAVVVGLWSGWCGRPVRYCGFRLVWLLAGQLEM